MTQTHATMESTLEINRLSLLEKVVRKIIHTRNESFLAEIEALLENETDDQVWNSLSHPERQYIVEVESEADGRAGRISHEQASQQIGALLKR